MSTVERKLPKADLRISTVMEGGPTPCCVILSNVSTAFPSRRPKDLLYLNRVCIGCNQLWGAAQPPAPVVMMGRDDTSLGGTGRAEEAMPLSTGVRCH